MDFSMIAMLLGWIGLFLFGMNVFEDTIRTAFWSGIKTTIQRYAGWLRRSMGIGVVSTAILQSSLIVIILMLGFVGAGILNLTQGLGVVLGSNIGTTITPWLIALVGFKMDIEALTLPIIGLGAIFLIAGMRYKKLQSIAKFIIWFGLLFLGLGYMKESVDVLAASFSLAEMNLNLFMSIVIWFVVTVAMQTSTWSTVLTLTALSSGFITFDIALGIIIGANLWSSFSTFLVGYLGSDPTQKLKRVIAMTHLGSNAIMMVLMIILLKPVSWFMMKVGLSDDPVIGIAAFHTLYNMIGVAVLAPFVRRYVQFLHDKWYVDREETYTNKQVFAVEQLNTTLPEEYLAWMKVDVHDFVEDVISFLQQMADHTITDATKLIEQYSTIKGDMQERLALIVVYDSPDMSKKQRDLFEKYQLVVAWYLSTLKELKDIAVHYYDLQQTKVPALEQYIEKFDAKLLDFIDVAQRSLNEKKKSTTLTKIRLMLREQTLDDSSFIRTLRQGVVRHSEDTQYQKAFPHLIQINRAFITSGESLLRASSYYMGSDTITKFDMLTN